MTWEEEEEGDRRRDFETKRHQGGEKGGAEGVKKRSERRVGERGA